MATSNFRGEIGSFYTEFPKPSNEAETFIMKPKGNRLTGTDWRLPIIKWMSS